MASEQFIQLLCTLQSNDNAARTAAEKAFVDAKEQQPSSTLTSLTSCLNPAACDKENIRTQAATLLRRTVVHVGSGESAWSKVDAGVRSQIKMALMQSVESEPSATVRKIVVSCVSAIAFDGEGVTWPELVGNTFALAQSANITHQEAALQLLEELLEDPRYLMPIFESQQLLGSLVATGLKTQPLQAAAISLTCALVGSPMMDDSRQAMLQPVLPMLEAAVQGMSATDMNALDGSLQALVMCAMERPLFFKPRYREWVDMMYTMAAARGNIAEGCRALCLEWVGTIAEAKSKALLKVVPDLHQRTFRIAFQFMSEVQDDDSWKDIDEDEEEDDDESLAKAGEAKIDSFVKKLGFSATGKSLLDLMQQSIATGQWEGKYAAAMAIRASVEFVDNAAALDNMVSLLLKMVQEPHMRVRYAVNLALGQMCHDQEADFHNRWHSQLVPALVQGTTDPIDRCSAMAVGALEAVVSDLDEAILAQYAKPILEALVAKLTSSSHRGVIICIIECIGALAAGLEGNFEAYYEQLMKVMLGFVSQADVKPESARIRGKAFECISLLGYAVGKETFAAAAPQVMSAMMATPLSSDSDQTECIRGAMERICTTLGTDFAPFLPQLLPGVLSAINLQEFVSVSGEDGEDDEDNMIIPKDDKSFYKVNTQQMQDILATVELLRVFVKETGPGFLEYVKPTAEALGRILLCCDPVLQVASSVRDAVYPCWAELVDMVTKTVPSRGQESQAMAVQLVQTFMDKVAADLVKAEDPSDIAPMASGLASVVRNAGAGCLQPAQAQCVCDLALSEILKSFQRETSIAEANTLFPPPGCSAAQDEDEDEDEVVGDGGMKGEEEEEQECRLGLCSIFGGCMKASPDVFVAHSWPKLQPILQEWLGPKGGIGHAVGIHIASEVCEHLGANAVSVWPVFMDQVMAALAIDNPDVRNTAAFTVMLAAQVPAFGAQYGGAAYTAVTSSLKKFKPKKNDDDAQRATDNTVAALVQLVLSHPSISPNLDACWDLAFAKMPLKVDCEEGQKLNRKLFVEAQNQSAGSLGNPQRVAKVLGYLCEIYGQSKHCDEELQKDLAKAFASLPQETATALFSQFSAKQQSKVQKIVQDGQK